MKTQLQLWLTLLATLAAIGCASKTPPPPPPPPPPQPVVAFTAAPVAAQAPVPTGYHLSTQHKMQAVEHWALLARDVAGQIGNSLGPRQADLPASIYVAPSGTTLFEKAFREQLITRLVEKGLTVTENDGDHLLLSFDILLVTHSEEKIVRTGKGVYKSLAPGFVVNRHIPLTGPDGRLADTERAVYRSEVNTDAGIYTVVLPENEIMITTSLTYNGGYLMRNSATYYINDPDWWHYKRRAGGLQPTVVNYQIVDK